MSIMLLTFAACRFYDEYKQFLTFRDMQLLSGRLEVLVKSSGLKRAAMLEVIKDLNDGKDAWGREYLLRFNKDATSFILVSLGSDGDLDVPSILEYFNLDPVKVHDDHAADLVFRNGKAITYAGK